MPMPRSGLLAGCAIAAVMTGLAQEARAQAFNGSPSTQAGSVTYDRATPGVETITVNSPEAVIFWSTSNPSDFLPTDNIATYLGQPNSPEYTVLNRIIPSASSSPVTFNGTVESFTDSSQDLVGGNIWFYSPNGIVAGPNSVFNVGSLILTANDIQFDVSASGSIFGIGTPSGVQFRGAADSAAAVEIQTGAQINALAANAYVALVAPRVVQNGSVSADGNIAYIAAEQVDMTINGGLFDFQLLVGTTDENGIVHTGTTTGPASSSFLDTQRISMVALPKNDALTMLLSGSIGYTPAANVFEEGSSIVLAAGFDSPDPKLAPSNSLGSIEIGNTTFENPLTAWASNGITVAPAGGTVAFGGTAALNAAQTIDITATEREFVTAAGDLFLTTGTGGNGGSIDLLAFTSDAQPGGVIDVAGNLIAEAASEGILPLAIPPVDTQGGAISITADGGRIAAANLFADAGAEGGFDPSLGGIGRGGTIDVEVLGGGTIAAGFVDLVAGGRGGASDTQGGDGFGGGVTLSDLGGSLDLGYVFLSASGSGGDSAGTAGNGTGGTVRVSIAGQAQDWDFLGLDSSGSAGGPAIETSGLSGSASGQSDGSVLSITGPGALTLGSDLVLTSNAYLNPDGAAGFTGQGGGVSIDVAGGGTLNVAGTIFAHASAILYDAEDLFVPPLSTPTQRGGTVAITAQGGGGINAFGLDAHADAYGMSAVNDAGAATGGTATVSVLSGGTMLLDNDGPTQAVISASGFGAPGPAAADAFGGTARLLVEDGTFTVSGFIPSGGGSEIPGVVRVSANAQIAEMSAPPPPGPGFNATGGTASVELLEGMSGTARLIADEVRITADGDARLTLMSSSLLPSGDGIEGNGGDGTGGTARLVMEAGTLNTDVLFLDSHGIGGASAASGLATPYQSGDGTGGRGEMFLSGGTLAARVLAVRSEGQGGGGAASASGDQLAALAGSGTGGTILAELSGAAALLNTGTNFLVTGTGGNGMGHTGSGAGSGGGTGLGGSITLRAADWTGDLRTDFLNLVATGQGGSGGSSGGGLSGAGGLGTGGIALAELVNHGLDVDGARLDADGRGGNGATGGEGHGGQTRLSLVDPETGTPTRTFGSVSLSSNGIGGVGSASGLAASGRAGRAVFDAQLTRGGSPMSLGSVTLHSEGTQADASAGAAITHSGAPLQTSSLSINTAGDVDIVTAEGISVSGSFAVRGRSYRSTGPITAAISSGSLSIIAPEGITAERLESRSTTLLQAANGAVSVSSLVSSGAVTALGRSIDIVSPGALSFADLDATAGSLSVVTADALNVATADAAGPLTLHSTAGAVTASGAVNAGGGATIEGRDGVTLPFLNSGGNTTLTSASGAIDVDTLVSSGPVAVTGASVDIVGSGALTFTTAEALNQLSIVTGGDLALASVSAGQNLTLRSTGGSLRATGDVTGLSGTLSAAGDILLDRSLTLGGSLHVDTGGSFTVVGDASTGDADILADQGISMTSLASGALTRLEAPNGAIVVPQLLSGGRVTAIGNDVNIGSSGSLLFDDVRALLGDVRIDVAGDLTIAGAFASDEMVLESGGVFGLSGDARAFSIDVTSADVVLGAGARLGVRDATSELTLRNGDAGTQTYIGGADGRSGYSLDANEASRLFADQSLTILAQGDVTIDDLALRFGAADANLGAGGRLEISSPSTISVIGDVALTTATADDTFVIDPELIAIDTATGSIALANASGAATGRLVLIGDTVAAATGAVLDQLGNLSSFDAISSLLGQPGGSGDPLRAGTIDISVTEGLYIQNSGASAEYADRRGFAAGALNIETASSATQIAINGQILRPEGAATGLDTEALVSINGEPAAAGGQFDPRSTINGCIIGADCSFVPEPEPPHRPLDPPSDDDLSPFDPGDPSSSFFVAPLIELAGTEPLIDPPLVDEPITGVGNDDLWQPRCEEPDENGACPEASERQ